MTRYLKLGGVACLVLLCAYGCTSDDAKKVSDTGAAGDAGAGEDASPSGGSSTQGGDTGAGNASGMGDMPSGGVADQGGAAGELGGTGGEGGGETNQQLADVSGPTKPDQSPLGLEDAQVHVLDSLIQIRAADADGKGNIFVLGGDATSGFVAKYGSDDARKWLTRFPSSQNVLDAVANADGEIFVCGSTSVALSGETALGDTDAFVGKLNAAGQTVWAHQLGSSGADICHYVATGPDGSVAATGSVDGQLAGNPPDNSAGLFVTRYSAAGAASFAKQYSPREPSAVLVPPSGDIYVGSDAKGPILMKIVASGALQSSVSTSVPISNAFATGVEVGRSGGVGFAPDYGALYTFDLSGLRLNRLDGSVAWRRKLAAQTAIIDPVEGVEWHGEFITAGTVTVSDDAIYVTGVYRNSYQKGSSPRPSVEATYVGRYDLQGKLVWFQEYQGPGTLPSTFVGSLLKLWVEDDGNLTALFTPSNGLSTKVAVVRFDSKTGVPL